MKHIPLTLLLIIFALQSCSESTNEPSNQMPPTPNVINGFNTIIMDTAAFALDENMGWETGMTAPEFRWKAGDSDVSISDYKGFVVVMMFWTTTCGACTNQAPYWVDIWNEYRERDLMFIAYSLDRDYDEWYEFVTAHRMYWVNIADGRSWSNSVPHYYNVGYTPFTVIIGKNGRIRHRGALLGMEYDKIFEELLAE